MRNLFLFLAKYYGFFVFIALEVVCAILIIRFNHFQRTRFLSSAGFLSANVLNAKSSVTDYFSLTNQNTELSEQNAALLEQLHNGTGQVRYIYTEDSCLIEEGMAPSIWKGTTVDTASTRKLYKFIPAKIINKTTLKLHNYLTINKGENQGVFPQMGVMGPNGVVGIVHKTSANYATVMTVLHKESRISALLKKNSHFGSLIWDGKNEFLAYLKDIPTNVSVVPGDTIVTSGYSDFFPEDIMVGTVENVDREPGSNFHTIQLQLSTIFRKIEHVYVIDFKDRDEVRALESNNINE